MKHAGAACSPGTVRSALTSSGSELGAPIRGRTFGLGDMSLSLTRLGRTERPEPQHDVLLADGDGPARARPDQSVFCTFKEQCWVLFISQDLSILIGFMYTSKMYVYL